MFFHLLSYLPMLAVHLHKEYFHYFRGFWIVGLLFSKGACPRGFHRVVQCEWELSGAVGHPYQDVAWHCSRHTRTDSLPCNLQLPRGPGVAPAAVPQIKALTDSVSPSLSLTITKLTFYNEKELPTLALMEILNTFNIYIYIFGKYLNKVFCLFLYNF